MIMQRTIQTKGTMMLRGWTWDLVNWELWFKVSLPPVMKFKLWESQIQKLKAEQDGEKELEL